MKKFEQQTLVIDRGKWRTGLNQPGVKTGKGSTELLNASGYMCCLGFFSNQLGVPDKDLIGLSCPADMGLDWDIPFLLDKKGKSTFLANMAMVINDNTSYGRATRERKLKRLFKDHGIKVIFNGEYETKEVKK